MTSKEIVLRAIERNRPPRVPRLFCNRDIDESDIVTCPCAAARDFVPSEPGMTEWGYAWGTLDQTMGQPHAHPLADPCRIASYKPPDPFAPGRLDPMQDFIAANRDRFLRSGTGISGFNAATFLRGFAALLEDLYVEPERAGKVLDFVFDFENGLIDQMVRYDIDAITFGDDWGTQQGLMISPELWRQVFKPRYAVQFAKIRKAGKKVWFHSCGNVHSVIGDLIDIGVDVLEFLQPDLYGVESLGHEFGGRVCFCCSVDHQRRAISGTRDEIFAYATRLKEHLGRFNGGFIAYIEDYASLGMSEQNYQWIKEAFAPQGQKE